jgi:hypothetical protein
MLLNMQFEITNVSKITDEQQIALSPKPYISESGSSVYKIPITHPKVLYIRNLLKPPSPPRIPRDTQQPKHGLFLSRDRSQLSESTINSASSHNFEPRIPIKKSDVILNIGVNRLLKRRNRENPVSQ